MAQPNAAECAAKPNPCHVGKWQRQTVPQAIKSSFGNILNGKLIFKLSISIRHTLLKRRTQKKRERNRNGGGRERREGATKKHTGTEKNSRLKKSQQRTHNKAFDKRPAKSFR